MRRIAAGVCLGFAFVCATATSAAAAASTVSLSPSAVAVDYGDPVHLTGQISPAAGGEPVDLVDAAAVVLDHATTDPSGSFSFSFSPSANATVHADWNGDVSADVAIGVRAVLAVHLGPVRLFDHATVTGTVAPASAGARVNVTLLQSGRAVERRSPVMGPGGGFRARLLVSKPGVYRVRASFGDATHLRGWDGDGPRATPLPNLHVGSTGIFVLLLERRLTQLHYRLVDVNQRYDARTADAVLAFRKVQRMPRTFGVDPAVWRAMASPIVPRPRLVTRARHIEVNQTLQVLYTVQRGTITHIMHVSTGKPSTPTHDGAFWVYRKVGGFSTNHLYYPSYFDGYRAIHGWTEVPTYAASHGCIRVPYWNARWIYGLAAIGTRVLVYH